MIDVTQPQSAGWWLQRLLTRLGEKRSHYEALDAYYDGNVAIPIHADRACSDAYRRLMAVSRTNWAELVVEAVRERMQPVGFRTGASGDDLGDDEAWRIWQANSLDADSSMVHAASLSMGMSYVIVGPVDEEIGAPLITPEDPREVIVETDPKRRRKVLAGLKAFHDDVYGVDRAYLYLPGVVHYAIRRSPTSATVDDQMVSTDAGGWEWEKAPVTFDGTVPVVPFPNRPKRGSQVTRGEYETHLPLLDRINYSILQRVEIATMQAFRQRAVIGDFPDNDDEGNPIDYDDLFAADPGALWRLPETAKMWESGQVDLGPVRQAIRDDVQDLAAVTRTPLFYLTPEATNGSAEGASLAREGLIFKTKDRIVEASEAWEQVMAHAFRFAGDTERADRVAMEVIWEPPERYSLAQMADAAGKAVTSLSQRAVLQRVWNMTPQEIDEVMEDKRVEALTAIGASLTGQVIGAEDPAGSPPPR